MIQILILYLGAVLVDDNGHETLATFAYIMTGFMTLIWLMASIAQSIRAANEEEPRP